MNDWKEGANKVEVTSDDRGPIEWTYYGGGWRCDPEIVRAEADWIISDPKFEEKLCEQNAFYASLKAKRDD